VKLFEVDVHLKNATGLFLTCLPLKDKLSKKKTGEKMDWNQSLFQMKTTYLFVIEGDF